MSNHVFTEIQAEHASKVVLKLMKKRRFFLYQPNKWEGKTFDYKFDDIIFAEALELDSQICEIYTTAKKKALKKIINSEEKLGINKPDLDGNKQLVDCKCYTGGLDICCVYPITTFSEYISGSPQTIQKQNFQCLMAGQKEDDLSPKKIRGYKDLATKHAGIIWKQLETMRTQDPNEQCCVVIMKTRFSCEGFNPQQDFMHGKVLDMQKFPHAIGYLFYVYSMRKRLVHHNHIVFSTSRKSHVRIQHWNNEKPSIQYDANANYTCPVFFATVL